MFQISTGQDSVPEDLLEFIDRENNPTQVASELLVGNSVNKMYKSRGVGYLTNVSYMEGFTYQTV